MKKPSNKWKKLRRAALERARRNIVEPLEPLHMVLLATNALYLIGFLRLTFAGQPYDFTWISGAGILAMAFFGLLVPILTGSVLTLHFASRRFDRLMSN
ncbi:hypothetical protein [Sulfitobacter sp. S190]|uniref:hypothetical protein n=1 Tax=Sulfitobacter sp. S190 TaxID=2867022 RepID=UPI0021A6D142|nr:hypothetical protein [Sulfitobacter sp. S190]UWR22623.1 hypothetical protein K3756_01095 [Sulfitobacter sp. S190]